MTVGGIQHRASASVAAGPTAESAAAGSCCSGQCHGVFFAACTCTAGSANMYHRRKHSTAKRFVLKPGFLFSALRSAGRDAHLATRSGAEVSRPLNRGHRLFRETMLSTFGRLQPQGVPHGAASGAGSLRQLMRVMHMLQHTAAGNPVVGLRCGRPVGMTPPRSSSQPLAARFLATAVGSKSMPCTDQPAALRHLREMRRRHSPRPAAASAYAVGCMRRICCSAMHAYWHASQGHHDSGRRCFGVSAVMRCGH